MLAMMLTLALTMNLSACAMKNPKAEGDGQTEETGTAANEDAADPVCLFRQLLCHKAVKVRSMEAQVWQDVISCMGATPVPVAYTELYTALQTGVVQGQDNPVAKTNKAWQILRKHLHKGT